MLPPFPRYAVVNPMHALVDHAWACAAYFAACVAGRDGRAPAPGRPAAIVLRGVRRAQVARADPRRDITATLDLGLEELVPSASAAAPMPDALAGPPTWGQ